METYGVKILGVLVYVLVEASSWSSSASKGENPARSAVLLVSGGTCQMKHNAARGVTVTVAVTDGD
jgi:hypothetical protein